MNRLSAEKRRKITELRAAGHTVREIVKEVGCSREAVTSYGIGVYRRRLFKMVDGVINDLEEAGFTEAAGMESLMELHGTLGWSCPIHPEALPDDDVGPDRECRLCVRDGLKRHHERRKAEGRPIFPPWQRRKVKACDKAVEELVQELPEEPKEPTDGHGDHLGAETQKTTEHVVAVVSSFAPHRIHPPKPLSHVADWTKPSIDLGKKSSGKRKRS